MECAADFSSIVPEHSNSQNPNVDLVRTLSYGSAGYWNSIFQPRRQPHPSNALQKASPANVVRIFHGARGQRS